MHRSILVACLACCLATTVNCTTVGSFSTTGLRSSGSPMRLKGGMPTAPAPVRVKSVDEAISVYSKKDRLALTLADFMREETLRNPTKDNADLEHVFSGISAACRAIADMVSKAGIQDMTGLAGTGENIQGEEQKKLDILSNDVFKDKLRKTGCMAFLGSEEEDSAVVIRGPRRGDMVAVFDPLDGSSNIDAAISVGTIFGIYKGAKDKKEFPLQKGTEQIAAGYCMYSTCTILMITTGSGVNGFTLDTSLGEFVLTHPNVQMPKRGKIYSTNQGNCPQWSEKLRSYFDTVSSGKGQSGEKYGLRYIGSMVGDMHRTLLYGGLFLYPADAKNVKGKLRLLYEANPMAMLAEQAGGKASTGEQRVMEIQPDELHQRCPIFIGSAEDVDEVVSYVN
mmetsp:Transcript_7762/g.18303  ORF Transcript_7762/g.18303 Transcript_7762/m.18303 type:complete len:394 (-) Transcript_7762:314-1495(-)